MTWDEIYEKAEGAACGEPALKAKDEARYQVVQFVTGIGCPDPEKDEIPEDTIERYCDAMAIQFDECGNITNIHINNAAVDKTIKEEERPELVGQIIDLFEDFLDEKGIVLENEERDEDMDEEDPDSIANIYGSDYGELQDGLEKIFHGWKIF